MLRDHKLISSHTVYRQLIASAAVIMVAFGAALYCQTALTVNAQADDQEQAVTFMEVGNAGGKTAESDLNDADHDQALSEAVSGDADEMRDEKLETDNDINIENDEEAVFFVLPEGPINPEPFEEEVIDSPEDDDPESSDQARTIENIKLRSGGISANPMDVLLDVVARLQQQGSTIRVISSDPTTGRVIYATD